MTTFTVITPSFNQGQFIERTIRSVLSQRGDFDLEYLVLDGGSTDNTLEILERYRDQLNYSSGPDNGQVDAINRGLKAAKGEFVGWLNSDDVLLPGALDSVVSALREQPDVEWVHGRCHIINADDRIIRRWISLYKHLRASRHSLSRLLTENYVSQMTVFWRRSLVEDIGLLDESLSFTFDYEYWLRLAKRGAPKYLKKPLACFRWHDSTKSGANFREQFKEDSEVARRHAPNRPFILFRKRLKKNAILATYGTMAGVRRLFGKRVVTVLQPYNRRAIHYDVEVLPELLTAHMPSGPLALADLGCGDGPLFRSLESGGFIGPEKPVWAVDLEDMRLQRVRNRFPYVLVEAAFADDVPSIPDGSLDVVLSTMVLEHVPDELKFLREIHRMLRAGGLAFLTTVYKKPWAWYFRKRDGESVLDNSHRREYTDLGVFRELLARADFKVVGLETRGLWFPLVDPLLFRIPHKWSRLSKVLTLLRPAKLPIPGYYSLNVVVRTTGAK